ncbi:MULTISPECIES: hypothetical protein [Paenibacillus]|uniref:hypothetical protein n=1 Tax=Paenibacillus TaxID=44249 RepID=UPI00096EE2C1|nr:hypothetical protein [Paenibacillus odorifer]OME05283.1 hypothetical protein BSK60_33170 [Paenibacillus odorifer]
MRTLFEIVEDAKDGKSPENNELLYALLVYCSMFNIEHRQLREELMRDQPQPQFLRDMKLKSMFDMFNTALEKSPKEYLGWNNDPANQDYLRQRVEGKKLVDKIVGQSHE